MKRTLLIAAGIFSSLLAQSQVIVDTVSIGAGYTHQTWYSLENGEQGTHVDDDWDIAFQISSMGSSVHINSAAGAELFIYPGDTADFTTLDTSGITAWQQLYNADTSWDYGAFSNYQGGFDIGWGMYNMVTHAVTGDSLYVLKLANGDFQKVFIQSLENSTYSFRHATLDNSVDVVHDLAKSDFSGKNFGYYNLTSQQEIDREPASVDWDLVFTQYTAFVPVPYSVSGVLSNSGVSVAEVHPVVAPTTYSDYSAHTFDAQINAIGYDWKSYAGGWQLEDSLVYFVETAVGDIWRLVFSDFGGSSTGEFIFAKEKLAMAGLEEENDILLSLYPNPAAEQLKVTYMAQAGGTELLMMDMRGKIVLTQQWSGSGLHQHTIDLSSVKSGVYICVVRNGGLVSTQRVVVSK